jgi:hypothetical protein
MYAIEPRASAVKAQVFVPAGPGFDSRHVLRTAYFYTVLLKIREFSEIAIRNAVESKSINDSF